MKIGLESSTANYQIRSYADDKIIVNEEHLQRSFVIAPEVLIRDWRPRSFADLESTDLEVATALQPEILLLGTGRRQHFPGGDLRARILSAGIGLEVMDTHAACRTFNVLSGEGRKVVAALLMG